MEIIEKSNYYGYPKNKMWYAVEFNFSNPTTSPYTLDLFNGYNQVPLQTYPNPVNSPSVVSGNIPVGTSPVGMAYNSVNNYIYVSNYVDGTVSVIDCLTNLVITTITVGTNPTEMALNTLSNQLYVVNVGSSNIYVIDCGTNLVIGTPISTVVSSNGIAYNPINNSMYFSNLAAGTVKVLDCSTNLITATILVAVGVVNFITYNSVNNSMYVSSVSFDSVYVIDCDTNSLIGSPIPVGSTPQQMAFNSFNNTLYVCNSNSDNISVIDCNSNTVSVTIPLPVNYNYPYSMLYNNIANSISFSCRYFGNISDCYCFNIDCSNNSIIGLPFFTGAGARGSAFNSTSNSVYICNLLSNDVANINSATPFVTYVSGTTNYNQFVAELNNIPKRVRQMRLIVDNSNQLSVPFNILKRDANGNFCNSPKIPTEYLDANDYQGFICEMPFKPKELILNNQMIISQYTIAPNSTVKMVIYFDEIDMSDLLSEKLNVYNQIETKVEDLNTISEKTLDIRYEDRPSVKPDWLKNFKGGKSIKI